MALHLKLKPRTLTNLRTIQLSFSSSSSTPPPPDSTAAGDEAEVEVSSSAPPSPAPSPFSYFSEIKDRLKSPPSPPRRIPDNPPPPPFAGGHSPAPVPSFEEVRKHLAEFRQRSQNPPPRSPPQTLSFQDLFKKSVANRGSNEPERSENLSFDSIRESLKQLRKTQEGVYNPQSQSPSPFNANAFSQNLRSKISDQVSSAPPILGPRDQLPDPIFWKELREKNKGEGEEAKGLKTEFLITYTYEELGEKLRRLRPDKGGFSLSELNERLAKLRQLEEENESRIGGVPFSALRESLLNLRENDAHQKVNFQKLSILTTLGGQVTEAFMLKPPQEQLLEKYLHPDHMSSEEKMKLELKKVRDEFKMSESDCGSTRVQVAQLTTKIKYLSKALHKKDKHSRKGLLEMVQRRKKLLKYLRRTDWDSYCLVLSKLGLRDVPEYKVPDYKA